MLGGAAAGLPLAALAQQGEPDARRSACSINLAENDPQLQAQDSAISSGRSQRLGWTEGRDVRIDMRFAGRNADQLPGVAKELVASQPDVILAQITPAVGRIAEVRPGRNSECVCLCLRSCRLGLYCQSWRGPAATLPGLLLYEEGIVGKWLGMLKEIAPQMTHVTLIANRQNSEL